MNFKILSYENAMEFKPEEGQYNVMIRIVNPKRQFEELTYRNLYQDVLELKFLDYTEEQIADNQTLVSDYDEATGGFKLFSDEDAEKIITFFNKHQSCDLMAIHCHMGKSRSAGVGVGWCKFNNDIEGESYIYRCGDYFPNKMVVEKMTCHLNQTRGNSGYQIMSEEPAESTAQAEIAVEIKANDTGEDLPARVIVTASDGSHPDGGGNGIYADGRFFTEGRFSVIVPAGKTEIIIRNGPNYKPLTISMAAAAGKKLSLRVFLHCWFSPEKRGWYSGDNHVHSQHDQIAKMKTGLAYTALQGRANGLSYITESGSHVSYENMEQFSTKNFLLKYAHELGAGCYIGHFIMPGIERSISQEELEEIGKMPFPGQAIAEAVHRLGGIATYTHPLTPVHQLHWMGAAEAFSDAVLGRCADLYDVDSKATELFWYSILNLGNKVACSSYTDSTLERINTLTPGDRRVYCQASEFTYPSIVEALRKGRTFATNGGPLYAFFTIDDHQVGDTITVSDHRPYKGQVEIQSLYPIKKAELYRNGQVIKDFEIAMEDSGVTLEYSFQEMEKSWYLLRVEDEFGNWCITSPIYFEPVRESRRSSVAAILLEISNHGRFVYLRRDFFAHLIVTVSPDQSLKEVRLLKNGKTYKRFTPDFGDKFSSGKVPVTEMTEGVEYGLGWLWYPDSNRKVHFRADCPVVESGWYSVYVKTEDNSILQSDAVYYDHENTHSHELSVAHLWGEDTRFELWGYGEEMPLDDIKEPYEDRWWFPNNTAWRIYAQFGKETHELHGEHPYLSSITSKQINSKLQNLFKNKEG